MIVAIALSAGAAMGAASLTCTEAVLDLDPAASRIGAACAAVVTATIVAVVCWLGGVT